MADTVAAMSADDINSATQGIQQDVHDRAVASGQDVESRQAALAPGLAGGSDTPGGYNYQRFVTPNIAPMVDNLTVNAKQNILRQLIKDADFQTQQAYRQAQYGQSNLQLKLSEQQFAYQKAKAAYDQYQAEQAERRRQAAAAQQAALLSAVNNSNKGRVTGGGGLNVISKSAPTSGKSVKQSSKVSKVIQPATGNIQGSSPVLQGSNAVNIQGGSFNLQG